jgi:hypothetical protein
MIIFLHLPLTSRLTKGRALLLHPPTTTADLFTNVKDNNSDTYRDSIFIAQLYQGPDLFVADH